MCSSDLGVTDGKAVGTYLEHKFTTYLAQNYSDRAGNSALGIDLPALEVVIQQAGSTSGIFRVR